ncbi:MAG: serine/threonine protein kinase [Kofleriaceae bacterium]|nr:serine/threonine protein kinase [Kofleriaceae bacterium]
MTPSARWWQRLLGRGKKAEALPATTEPSPTPAEPTQLGPDGEAYLQRLALDAAEGKRLADIGGADMTAALDTLWAAGHEQLAIGWLEKFLGAPSTPAGAHDALRAALVERYERRADLRPALVHLEVLVGRDAHATRAHYLLGEHFRRAGDDDRALRHYEAVLGRDVDYPNVRARVDRLRARTGRTGPTAGETVASVDLAGATGGARYRLVRELGRGATGVVYLARDADFGRDVAVKLLHPHLAGDRSAEALAQFFHEARVMAGLRHPNVVAVLDLDERARRIVMELAAGGTLRDLLRGRGPRPLRRAMERHVQILSALAAAHRRGIVHRDLKPGNLLFRRDPDLLGVEIMLGDFGVAHLPESESTGGRRAEAVGTLAYMAPEQRRGEVTAASDLYAAAIVLFEMLVGRVPWPREVVLAGTRHADDVVLPAAATTGMPPALLADVQAHLRALGDPDPARRPSTSAALAEAVALRARTIAAEPEPAAAR